YGRQRRFEDVFVVIEELLTEMRYRNRRECHQGRCTGGQLGIHLGGDLLGLRANAGRFAAHLPALGAIVKPPGAVVEEEGHPSDAATPRTSLISARHRNNSRCMLCAPTV